MEGMCRPMAGERTVDKTYQEVRMRDLGFGGERCGREDRAMAELLRDFAQDEMRIREVRYDKGNTVFDVEEPAYWLVYIVSGEVDLVKRTLAGERFTIQRLGPGDLLGLEAILPDPEDRYRRYTAEVIVPIEALLVERADFWRLLEMPALRVPILNALCCMLHEGAVRLEYLLAGKGSLEKVAGALLCLSRFRNAQEGLPLQVTYAQIASFIGMRAETVCNRMKTLERRDALVRENGTGMILRKEALRGLMGELL